MDISAARPAPDATVRSVLGMPSQRSTRTAHLLAVGTRCLYPCDFLTLIEGPMPSSSDVTALLVEWTRGDRQALDRLLPLVYDELRRIAARQLRRERMGH